jgi:hypothetical protein
MRRTSVVRFLTSVIIAAFVMAGPLAPLANAQQPAPAADTAQAETTPVQMDTVQAQPAAPVETVQAQPAAPPQPAMPPPPAQPDLFQEKLKAERASDRSQGFYNAEAVIVNLFLVPGRVITCAAGGIVGVTILAVSFGTGYRPASYMFHEGCGGKWIVKGDDLRPDIPSTSYASDPVR